MLLRSVNQEVARRYLYMFLALTGIGGAGKILPNIWEQASQKVSDTMLAANFGGAENLFLYSMMFAIIGVVLILMIVSKTFDAQLIFAAAKCSFLVSLLYLFCALVAYLPDTGIKLHKFLVITFVIFGIFYIVFRGLLFFYWERRSYGDIIAELVVYAIFVGFMWIPIKEVTTGG